MIDLNQIDSEVLEGLAKLAENNGRPDRAAAIRKVIRDREATEAAELAKERARLAGVGYPARRRGRWYHG